MLSCSCNFDSDDYDYFYYNPTDFSTLEAYRRKRCTSCGKLIDIGAIVVAFNWYRIYRSEGGFTMKDKITILLLSIKYYLQGDTWKDAVKYAKFIVEGFER